MDTKKNAKTKSAAKSKEKAVVRSQQADRPGPGRPTKDQAKLRGLELLDHALDLFSENGYERTTMDDIAASLGMAKRTIYSQYGDKKSLFKAALQHAIDDWIIPVEQLQALETESLEETLVRVGQLLVENMLSDSGLRLLRITNAEAYRMPEIAIFTNEQGTQKTLQYLSDLFRHRIKVEKGVSIDAKLAAFAFLNLVVGTPANSTTWGSTYDKQLIRQHTRYTVKLFLHGVLHEK